VIVSLDKDLLSLGEFEGTRILRPSAFLALLESINNLQEVNDEMDGL